MNRVALRTGEYLAIKPDVIQRDEGGFYFLSGPTPPDNEAQGSVTIVHIRGALCHYKGEGGDSYEAILYRVKCAIEADPKPSAILFRIESPGGVVAGLNECVYKLRRMGKESGVRLIAYVDEMATSAAYALCCACNEIVAPPSAVVGSIGCISTMVSQAKADELMGLDYRIITSGKRKADGHPHAAISDDAVRAEMLRNAELAAQFFSLAGNARGISPKKLQGLEAAIYLASQAERIGLIDDVMSLDDVLLGLGASEVASGEPVKRGEGNLTDRRAK